MPVIKIFYEISFYKTLSAIKQSKKENNIILIIKLISTKYFISKHIKCKQKYFLNI